MMKDEKAAKVFLSAIIEEEVVELNLAKPKRYTPSSSEEINEIKQQEENEETFYAVCQYYFSAKISLPEGDFKTVPIELLHSEYSSDIMRYRHYRRLCYQNANDTYCIFLIGYGIGIPDIPVIYVEPRVKDDSKRYLDKSDEFIQSLNHRSWIVQIDQLKRRRRNDLEKLLSIFDQENRVKSFYIPNENHVLNVDDEDFPEACYPVIRRLRMAYEDEQIRIEMEMEDDYMQELIDKERLIAQKNEERYKILWEI
jgi:hypothetical protein